MLLFLALIRYMKGETKKGNGVKRRMKRIVAGAAALLVALSAGCSKSDNDAAGIGKAWGVDEQGSIKVMYYDELNFFNEYGNLFYSKYPNINIEVISTSSVYNNSNGDYKTAYMKLIETEQPDVIMTDMSTFDKLAADGMLLELDPLMKRDDLKEDEIYPGLLQSLRDRAGGKLYAIGPRFSSQALFYNKDLFQKYGVPLPTDGMTWSNVLELAKRFPTEGSEEERIYGLYRANGTDTPFYLAMSMADTYGLSYIDGAEKKVTIQTDSWKQVLQEAVDAVKSGVLNKPKADPVSAPLTYDSYLKQNLFATGRAAMSVDHSYNITTLSQFKNVVKDVQIPNWDVVTMPVDPKNPDTTTSISWDELFGINAKSANNRAAWELVKYLNGEEYAKTMSRSPASNGLLARTKYNIDKEGHNIEAFYKLKPAANETSPYLYDIPNGFFQSFMALANMELNQVMDNKKSLDEALAALQTQGQASLDAALAANGTEAKQ
jgi:multiple sugar transport system substrate-binding protein